MEFTERYVVAFALNGIECYAFFGHDCTADLFAATLPVETYGPVIVMHDGKETCMYE